MRITWDGDSERDYTAGVSQGVLFPVNSPGVPWNGLISITQSGNQAQASSYYDGRRYYNRNAPASFAGTISAYTYPDELEPYIGLAGLTTGQPLQSFGFSYRSSNEIHIVYNTLLAPSPKGYISASDSFSPVAFSWPFTTLPEKIPGGRASAHIVILIDNADPRAITDLEALIYGDDSSDPSQPSPDDILALFDAYVTLRITDNGDGTWTADGPDDVVTMLDANTFQIDWPSAIFVDSDSYVVYSL